MRTIASKLMGYNKEKVNEYLEKIRKIQEDEIVSIRKSIEFYRQQRVSLVQELSVLQEEKSKYVESRELLELALKRSRTTVNLIDNAAQEDSQRIIRESKQRLDIHENYLVEIEHEINRSRLQMDSKLKDIFQMVKEKEVLRGVEKDSFAQKVVGTILPSVSKSESIISALGSSPLKANEDIIGKMVVTSNGAPVGRVGDLVINESTTEIEGFYLTDEQSAGGKYIHADWVMAIKRNSLVVSTHWHKESMWTGETPGRETTCEVMQEYLESQIEEQMTADGATAQTVNNTGRPIDIIGMMSSNSPESQLAVETATGESTGGFWDESDNYAWEGDIPPEENSTIPDEQTLSQENAAQSLLLTDNETASSIDPALVELKETFHTQESTPLSVAEEGAGQNEQVNQPTRDKQASPAVAKKIDTVRHKYIVGKLAGEDLLDKNGQIIINKNGLIMPEVVELAEKEGKLPELIIHMIIPGLEA